MAVPRPESGPLLGELPFIRFGAGPRRLVIFPPINDSLQDVTGAARFLRWYYRRFVDECTVYLLRGSVNRRVAYVSSNDKEAVESL